MIPLYYLSFFFIACANATTENFVLVLDTTGSMEEELNILKRSFGTWNFSANYVLTTFDDQGFSTPFSTKNPMEFQKKISKLFASGGQECPEDSLTPVVQAIETVGKNSQVYLLTDAFAKSVEKAETIKALCEQLNVQVNVFLSGYCVPVKDKSTGDMEVYRDIARACSGVFLRIDPSDYKEVFAFIRETNSQEWTVAASAIDPIGENVRCSSGELLAAVTGNKPSLIVQNPYGDVIQGSPLVQSANSMVLKFQNLDAGDYKFEVTDTGKTSLVVYTKREFPFEYGFSTHMPRSMQETSRRPMPGWKNYLLVLTAHPEKILEYAEIKSVGLSVVRVHLSAIPGGSGLYISTPFSVDRTIRITIQGHDADSYEKFAETSYEIQPQRLDQTSQTRVPTVEILDDTIVVKNGSSVTLACKVQGYPKPNITWTNDSNELITAENIVLEVPYVHISYVIIPSVSRNETYTCSAYNNLGVSQEFLEVFVNRSHYFEEIKLPTDIKIDFGQSGKLFCQVKTFPDGTTRWLHNGSDVDSFSVSSFDNTLTISEMKLDDIGDYECRVNNSFESRSYLAYVSIGGLEAPQINKHVDRTLYWKPGGSPDIQCSVIKGVPAPEIKWDYKPDESNLFHTIPSEATAYLDKITFSQVKSEHKGIYRCTASNAQGSDVIEFEVKIQNPPTILNKRPKEPMQILEGSNINLSCKVTADPSPRVWWEKRTDGATSVVSYQNTLQIMDVSPSDTGYYTCLADNNIGSDNMTVKIEVLVAPYIESPNSKELSAKTGDDVKLPCPVLYGHPTPTIQWKFLAEGDDNTVALEQTSPILELRRVSSAQSGNYTCVARNSVGLDNIYIILKVL